MLYVDLGLHIQSHEHDYVLIHEAIILILLITFIGTIFEGGKCAKKLYNHKIQYP